MKRLHCKNIVLVMLAESGAMGEPGAVLIVEKMKDSVQVNHANYCYGDFSMDAVAKIFPPLQTFDDGMFGETSGIAPGWNYMNLGAGNHLFVRDDLYTAFAVRTKEMSPEELYTCFLEIAVELLAKSAAGEEKIHD